MPRTIVIVPLFFHCFSSVVLADEPAPGVLVEKVTCGVGNAFSYACYLPKAYTAEKKWPILYCFSPGGEGAYFVRHFQASCEEFGWVVVGSNDSRNGPIQQAAIHAMWDDTRRRFSLHPKRVYATGFSGGARVSWWGSTAKEFDRAAFAGLILIGAAKSSEGDSPEPGVAIWLMCGEEDFNRKEMEEAKKEFDGAKRRSELRIFPGGHTMPPADLVRESVRWHYGFSEEGREETARKGLEQAREKKAEDPYESYLILTGLIRDCAGAPSLKEARKELDELRKDPKVKEETAAAAALEKVHELEKKEDPRKIRRQLASRYRKIVQKHPGTRAAEEAEKRATELESEK